MNNILFLWQAAAPGKEVGAGSNTLITWVFLGLGMIVFYFFLIRPQQKEQQQQKAFASSLKKGSKVVTIGGIHGTISELSETTVSVLIAPKTVITLQRSSISLELTQSVYGTKSSKSKSKETASV